MECKKISFFHHSIDVIDDGWATSEYMRRLADRYKRQGKDDPFYVMNVGEVFRKHAEWTQQLPRVEPYYAVKCNNNSMLLTILSCLGYSFDCASAGEIKHIMSLGVGANRIIFAHPCKPPSAIQEAAERGVKLTTFDNEPELMKLHELYSDAELVLRIATPDSGATFNLSEKYGCQAEMEAPYLLKRAAEFGMKIVGISFHVGSGCRKAGAYEKAIEQCHRLFQVAREYGHSMSVLDIGGGFPGYDSQDLTFAEISSVIRNALEKYFPPDSGVQIIGEPGRFYASSPYALCVNVIALKEVPASSITQAESDKDQSGFMYYLNDGIYGSFKSILFEGTGWVSYPKPLERTTSQKHWSTIWGPTCDNMDVVLKKIRLPQLKIGDWIVFENMGAYTISIACEFNGFKCPKIHYMVKETDS